MAVVELEDRRSKDTAFQLIRHRELELPPYMFLCQILTVMSHNVYLACSALNYIC